MLRRNTEHIRFKSVNDFPYPTRSYMYVGGDGGGYEPYYLPADWGQETPAPQEDGLSSPNPIKRAYSCVKFGIWALMCWCVGIALFAVSIAGMVMLVLGLFR